MKNFIAKKKAVEKLVAGKSAALDLLRDLDEEY